jgi:hypothetical protein
MRYMSGHIPEQSPTKLLHARIKPAESRTKTTPVNNLSILRRVVAVIFATGSIATTVPAAQFIETGGRVVEKAEHYTSKNDGVNHAHTFTASKSPMQIVATSNGAPWLYESMKTARQAITIPTLQTD